LETDLELGYYLRKNKISQKAFCEKIKIAPHTLNLLIRKKNSPTLLTALKIHFETNGKVSLSKLLKPAEQEILSKMYDVTKTESIS